MKSSIVFLILFSFLAILSTVTLTSAKTGSLVIKVINDQMQPILGATVKVGGQPPDPYQTRRTNAMGVAVFEIAIGEMREAVVVVDYNNRQQKKWVDTVTAYTHVLFRFGNVTFAPAA